MILVQQRKATAEVFNSALGNKVSCEEHGGRFTLEELKRTAVRGQAVLVSCLGLRKIEIRAEGTVATVNWGAYLVTKDISGAPRDVAALILIATLAPTIPNNDWDLDAVYPPKGIRADNLFSKAVDQAGIALWAISWEQETVLDLVDVEKLDDFLSGNLDYDITGDGEADATDDITLPQ